VPQDPNARLVYSTGGEGEIAPEKPEKKAGGRGRKHSSPTPASGPSPGIRLRLERRASDRIVTSISGLPGSGDELAALAKALKSACGTGGTVKGRVVELQGDHRSSVEAFLASKGWKSKRAGG
jgi:translation initiation factor 1